MVLPTMRATSTGNDIVCDILPAANSGKSVDKIGGLGDVNSVFGSLTAFAFASRVAGGEITEGDGLLDYNEYNQGTYFCNVTSLSGEMLADTSGLVGSDNPDVGYKKPNLRDRSTLFDPGRFSSPAIDK